MKAKILFGLLCVLPSIANAAIPYRVEQVDLPVQKNDKGQDPREFARQHKFYIGGAYDFTIWQSASDEYMNLKGKNTSSFEGYFGYRVFDTFRIEANYIHQEAKWNNLSMRGEVGMINALFDARIDSSYRLLRKQMLVPYVGLGAGLAWNSSDEVGLENKITPVASAMAGLGIELGPIFAVDFGYRYMYMFSPKFDNGSDIAPTAHQVRLGARVNF